MEHENESKIFKLPVSYLREENVITNAFVDQELLQYLARFRWFLADVKVRKPPKTQLRVNGTPKSFTLNRLAYALSLMNDDERDLITQRQNIDKLIDLLALQPKFRAKNNDPFDCRVFNIVPIAVKEIDPDLLKHHLENDAGSVSNALEAAKVDELKQRFAEHNDTVRESLTDAERKRHEVPDDVPIIAPLPGSGLVPEELQAQRTEAETQNILDFLK
jgi:hypothetical protein